MDSKSQEAEIIRPAVPVRFIVSVGEACMTGLNFKRLGLKKCSYPFDWASSLPQSIIYVLKHGVEPYLGEDPTLPSCYWPHHDIQKQEEADYLRRCTARLSFVVKEQKERTLFVHCTPHFKERYHNEMLYLRDEIAALNPQLDFDILSIRTFHDPQHPSVRMYRHSTHLIFVDVCAREEWWGENPECKGDHDLWDTILLSFPYDLVPIEQHGQCSIIQQENHEDTPFREP
jgi:hypothetical protein